MDFKKRLIEKLDLSTIAANTMYSVYIDVCEDVAKEYSAEQNKELIKYTRHLPSCQINNAGFLIPEEKRICTCGLNKLKNQ